MSVEAAVSVEEGPDYLLEEGVSCSFAVLDGLAFIFGLGHRCEEEGLLEGCVLDYCDTQFAAGPLREDGAHIERGGDGFEEVPS